MVSATPLLDRIGPVMFVKMLNPLHKQIENFVGYIDTTHRMRTAAHMRSHTERRWAISDRIRNMNFVHRHLPKNF